MLVTIARIKCFNVEERQPTDSSARANVFSTGTQKPLMVRQKIWDEFLLRLLIFACQMAAKYPKIVITLVSLKSESVNVIWASERKGRNCRLRAAASQQ